MRTATAAAAEEASRTTAPAARVTPVGGITGVSPPAPEGSEASEESGDGPGIRLRIGSVHQRLIGGLGGGQHHWEAFLLIGIQGFFVFAVIHFQFLHSA